jgi:predicted MPP superfamily phosphohydrolase
MSIQTDSTELANGSHKFKANIYIDDKLVSVGESKQMKNADKEFEKQQTVSIGRGLSILGFFGDELATAEEMEQFLKPQKKVVGLNAVIGVKDKKIQNKKNTKELADEWIEVLKKTATHSVSVGKFEQNLNPLRQEYLSDLKQINSDLIQQQRIDQEYISLQKQITTNRTK